MGTLVGLKGIRKKSIACKFISKPTEIRAILKKGLAIASSGESGCVNIWKDDKGCIRCESQKFMRTEDSQIFTKITDAEKWAKKWLKTINAD